MDLRSVTSQVKESLDLRNIIPDLQKSGSSYMMFCPFHANTKTPACQVNKEYYYCYSCGATGDVFSWYEKTMNITFKDALLIASAEAGIILEDDIYESVNKWTEKREERQSELSTYMERLWEGGEPLEYLHRRGLTDETIKHFQLGHRPDWNGIAIPIRSKGGNLESISFRYLNPDSKAPYYHKNTDTWRKGDTFYNASSIEFGEGPIYVCEGMFDCMSIWQAGFHRVVAVMGGNLNDNHIREIGENHIVFVPDRKKETDFELFRKSVFRVRRAHPNLVIKAALLPEGDANSVDPDVLKQAIESAEVAELAILKHDLRDSANRDAEYVLARRIVTQIADVLTKDDIERWLAERWGKPLDLIKQAMARPGDTVGTNVMTVSQALDSLEIRERTAAIDGLGFRCFGLQHYIKRPHGGQVAVIAGRTSVGKTMLALNLLHHSRENDIPTLFVSMEQPASELVYRLSLMSSEDIEPLNSDQLSKHVLDDDDHWRALRSLVEIGYPALRICDKILTAQEVADHVIDASYSIGEKVRLLVVDYIGLIKHGRGNLDSYERVSAIMREIQGVTKSLDVFGTYLCQLSRAAGDGSTRVTLDMMRDSGVVEEVADYIVGVWRDKDRNAYSNMNLTKMYSGVCKNRHGPLGDSELWLRTDTLTIRPVDQTHRQVKDTSQGREKVFDN